VLKNTGVRVQKGAGGVVARFRRVKLALEQRNSVPWHAHNFILSF
jgi:hypothetical protein